MNLKGLSKFHDLFLFKREQDNEVQGIFKKVNDNNNL